MKTTKTRALATALATAVAGWVLTASPAAAITFTALGDLLGGDFSSTAYAISNDGSTVVGTSSALVDFEAFRWTTGTGMLPLADLAGGGGEGAAYGVSGDGSLIAGYGTVTGGTGTEAASWSAPLYLPTDLGNLGGANPFSIANGVSGDGSVIVGETTTPAGLEAFLWTSGGGMIALDDFAGGPTSSTAAAVSDDGSVIVGRGSHFGPLSEAFRWTSGAGLEGLGDLAGGIDESRANGVSGDGATVVGDSRSASGIEAFVWTAGSGMEGLGDLAGGDFESRAHDASGDGNAIVGYGTTVDGQRATIWNATGQIFDLNGIAAAVLPAGWVLEEAFGVSADGLSIVGRGSNADGNNEAFLLTIDFVPVPEPRTALLVALGLVATAGARRRRAE